MLLCYVIDSGLSTSLLLLATLIIMFYIYIYISWNCYQLSDIVVVNCHHISSEQLSAAVSNVELERDLFLVV